MKTQLLFFALVFIVSYGQGRHMHPWRVARWEEIAQDDNKSEKMVAEIDEIPIDVTRNIRPNRFVPINSIQFFKTYTPCEDGLVRDRMGICRVLWD